MAEEFHEIIKSRFNPDFTIDAVFDDGQARHYNAVPYLKDHHYDEVLSFELFSHPMHPKGFGICWTENSDIDSDWIYYDGVPIAPF